MMKCNTCGVYIKGDAMVCPLCQHGLEEVRKEKSEPVYPEVTFDVHKYQVILRVFLFISIVLEGVLIWINVATYSGVWWALICGAAISYFWLTIKFCIQNNTNYAAKILVQTIAAMLFTVFVDRVVGYSGWSVNYALPSIVLVAYLAVLILMVVNFMNWQSFILYQIVLMIISVVLLILYLFRVITQPILTYVAALTTGIIFLATIVFGDKKAKNELKRRFHL